MIIKITAGARRGDPPDSLPSAPVPSPRPRRLGFTLVELMIVVVIIGMLASIAVPAFKRSRERTQNTRLANDLRQFRSGFEQYNLENGAWPPDVNEGQLPVEMEGYITRDSFESRTVVGGNYDWEGPDIFTFEAGITLRATNLQNEQVVGIDAVLDDGELGTGSFREGIAGNGYTLVLQE